MHLLQTTLQKYFYSRPREGGDRQEIVKRISELFLFTPPRRGRLIMVQECQKKVFISIHAPAKGATRPMLQNILIDLISIHAPAKGATRA